METPRRPTQKRSQETFEKLLATAQAILEEDELQGLTTNKVVEKLGMTPPTFYWYFKNKHELLEELARRLMSAQNAIITENRVEEPLSVEDFHYFIADILKSTLEVTRSFRGGYVLLVSLRSDRKLRPIRLKSHDEMALVLSEIMAIQGVKARPEIIRSSSRLAIEIGYGAIEMLFETKFKDEGHVLNAAACAISGALGVK